ncbi:hypothetical protein GEMRC1_009206 [Eukaryota sp. GEM-RC1]
MTTILLLLSVLFFLSYAFGIYYYRSFLSQTFTGRVIFSSSFHDASNWNPNQVPGSNDHAFITKEGDYSVILTAHRTIGSLTLGSDSFETVPDLRITNGRALRATNVTWISGTISGDGSITSSFDFLFTSSQRKTIGEGTAFLTLGTLRFLDPQFIDTNRLSIFQTDIFCSTHFYADVTFTSVAEDRHAEFSNMGDIYLDAPSHISMDLQFEHYGSMFFNAPYTQFTITRYGEAYGDFRMNNADSMLVLDSDYRIHRSCAIEGPGDLLFESGTVVLSINSFRLFGSVFVNTGAAIFDESSRVYDMTVGSVNTGGSIVFKGQSEIRVTHFHVTVTGGLFLIEDNARLFTQQRFYLTVQTGNAHFKNADRPARFAEMYLFDGTVTLETNAEVITDFLLMHGTSNRLGGDTLVVENEFGWSGGRFSGTTVLQQGGYIQKGPEKVFTMKSSLVNEGHLTIQGDFIFGQDSSIDNHDVVHFNDTTDLFSYVDFHFTNHPGAIINVTADVLFHVGPGIASCCVLADSTPSIVQFLVDRTKCNDITNSPCCKGCSSGSGKYSADSFSSEWVYSRSSHHVCLENKNLTTNHQLRHQGCLPTVSGTNSWPFCEDKCLIKYRDAFDSIYDALVPLSTRWRITDWPMDLRTTTPVPWFHSDDPVHGLKYLRGNTWHCHRHHHGTGCPSRSYVPSSASNPRVLAPDNGTSMPKEVEWQMWCNCSDVSSKPSLIENNGIIDINHAKLELARGTFITNSHKIYIRTDSILHLGMNNTLTLDIETLSETSYVRVDSNKLTLSSSSSVVGPGGYRFTHPSGEIHLRCDYELSVDINHSIGKLFFTPFCFVWGPIQTITVHSGYIYFQRSAVYDRGALFLLEFPFVQMFGGNIIVADTGFIVHDFVIDATEQDPALLHVERLNRLELHNFTSSFGRFVFEKFPLIDNVEAPYVLRNLTLYDSTITLNSNLLTTTISKLILVDSIRTGFDILTVNHFDMAGSTFKQNSTTSCVNHCFIHDSANNISVTEGHFLDYRGSGVVYSSKDLPVMILISSAKFEVFGRLNVTHGFTFLPSANPADVFTLKGTLYFDSPTPSAFYLPFTTTTISTFSIDSGVVAVYGYSLFTGTLNMFSDAAVFKMYSDHDFSTSSSLNVDSNNFYSDSYFANVFVKGLFVGPEVLKHSKGIMTFTSTARISMKNVYVTDMGLLYFKSAVQLGGSAANAEFDSIKLDSGLFELSGYIDVFVTEFHLGPVSTASFNWEPIISDYVEVIPVTPGHQLMTRWKSLYLSIDFQGPEFTTTSVNTVVVDLLNVTGGMSTGMTNIDLREELLFSGGGFGQDNSIRFVDGNVKSKIFGSVNKFLMYSVSTDMQGLVEFDTIAPLFGSTGATITTHPDTHWFGTGDLTVECPDPCSYPSIAEPFDDYYGASYSADITLPGSVHPWPHVVAGHNFTFVGDFVIDWQVSFTQDLELAPGSHIYLNGSGNLVADLYVSDGSALLFLLLLWLKSPRLFVVNVLPVSYLLTQLLFYLQVDGR